MDSDTLSDIWARLCRSVPLLGLIAHWSQYEKRITIAINKEEKVIVKLKIAGVAGIAGAPTTRTRTT